MATDVTLSNLTKKYGEIVAVDNLNLHIRAGEFFTLCGPDGCGKSTVLRMAAGIEMPDEGTVRFGDQDMTGVPPSRRNVGTVFQDSALFPYLTVRENMAFGLRGRHLTREEIAARIRATLTMVRLDGAADRRAQDLSRDEQRWAALARALVIRPNVLLLDEPLSGMDPHVRAANRTLLRELILDSGITTIHATPDREDALCLSDRMAVMKDGKIEQLGTPQEIYFSPANEFVALSLIHI